jgi:hypothetical protein
MTIRETDQKPLGALQQVSSTNRMEKVKKTAALRTTLGLYIAYHNATTFKIAVVAASCLPSEWAEKIESYSDEKINELFKLMPPAMKAAVKPFYIWHIGYVQGRQSIPVITPLIHISETVIASKLAVQSVNRILNATQEVQTDDHKADSTTREVIGNILNRTSVAVSTYALTHMVTKGKNIGAASVGASVTACFPEQAKEVHEKTNSVVNEVFKKMPVALPSMLAVAYEAHELYLTNIGPIPYVTPVLTGIELATSFYVGMKYMLRNILKAEAEADQATNHDHLQ